MLLLLQKLQDVPHGTRTELLDTTLNQIECVTFHLRFASQNRILRNGVFGELTRAVMDAFDNSIQQFRQLIDSNGLQDHAFKWLANQRTQSIAGGGPLLLVVSPFAVMCLIRGFPSVMQCCSFSKVPMVASTMVAEAFQYGKALSAWSTSCRRHAASWHVR